jgi:acyl dehydratase
LAAVIAWGAGISAERIGLNRRGTLHGEEALTLHQPVPIAGEIIADSRVLAVYDKGDKGAVVERETVLTDAKSGERLATVIRTAFARSDGGFGGPAESPPPAATPTRRPDAILEFPTRRDQALLYRLCGDRNPLHADPEVAQAAGFPVPILHGLCTYGICCRAVLQAFCDFEPARLQRHAVRFSSPVIPGDVVRVTLWQDGDAVSFEADVPARAVTVIKGGRALVV